MSVFDRNLAQRLYFTEVATCARSRGASDADMRLAEYPDTSGMSDERRREFAVGRSCARQALSQLAPVSGAIRRGVGGMPVWPEGVCGSIAHTDGMACAAVCPVGAVTGLGIDVERIRSAEPEWARIVCREEEVAALVMIETRTALSAALIAFVAKEAAYKALYPTLRQFLEFHDVVLSFSQAGPHGDGSFELTELHLREGRACPKLRGRWTCQDGFIFAGAEFELTPEKVHSEQHPVEVSRSFRSSRAG